MSRRMPASLRWTILAALLGVGVLVLAQSWSAVAPAADTGWTETRWGPLGPADRDLLQRVRLAGLWEAPTGQQAEQRASSPAVKEVGRHLATEHADLDNQVRTVADQLGVLLPSRPNDQQLGWMNDLSTRGGTDYDKAFVQIVRAAHGTILPLIAQVRAGTRNDLMRQFATTGEQFVSRHIDYLESTGLVDYSALPAPPDPAPTTPPRTMTSLIVPGIVVLGALLATVGLLTTLRRRGRTDPDAAAAFGTRLRAVRELIPLPRRAREEPPQTVVQQGLPIGPPDPWDELNTVPVTGPHRLVPPSDEADPPVITGVRRRRTRHTPRSTR
jgi:predicted outer membrane protein